MSGLECGEKASLYAAKLSSLLYERVKMPLVTEDDIRTFYKNTNAILKKHKHTHQIDFGTTAIVCFFCEKSIIVSNLGDSCIYVCKNGDFKRISIAHNDSDLSGKNTAFSNGLNQYFGCSYDDFEIDPYIISMRNDFSRGDYFILCSDGVSSSLSYEEIQSIMNMKSDHPAKALVEKAFTNGSKDNATAITVIF